MVSTLICGVTSAFVLRQFRSAPDLSTAGVAEENERRPMIPTISYSVQVEPLQPRQCNECHSADQAESGLRVDRVASVIDEGDWGAVFSIDRSSETLLIHAVRGSHVVTRMPFCGDLLDKASIEVRSQWIDEETQTGLGLTDVHGQVIDERVS